MPQPVATVFAASTPWGRSLWHAGSQSLARGRSLWHAGSQPLARGVAGLHDEQRRPVTAELGRPLPVERTALERGAEHGAAQEHRGEQVAEQQEEPVLAPAAVGSRGCSRVWCPAGRCQGGAKDVPRTCRGGAEEVPGALEVAQLVRDDGLNLARLEQVEQRRRDHHERPLALHGHRVRVRTGGLPHVQLGRYGKVE